MDKDGRCPQCVYEDKKSGTSRGTINNKSALWCSNGHLTYDDTLNHYFDNLEDFFADLDSD